MTVEQMLIVNKRMQNLPKKTRESPETTKTQKIKNKTIHS